MSLIKAEDFGDVYSKIYSTPAEIGLTNPKWKTFREEQQQALVLALLSKKRYVGLGVPMGGGKSLIAASIAQILSEYGIRTVSLTGTKNLQDQYKGDFEEFGLADVRGRDNYSCADTIDFRTGKIGSCKEGELSGCPHVRSLDCQYNNVKFIARSKDWVSTNYKYWISMLRNTDIDAALGEFGCMICDEGHDTYNQLADALDVELREKQLMKHYLDVEFLRKDSADEILWNDLREWANDSISNLDELIKQYEHDENYGMKRDAESIRQSLTMIRRMDEEHWMVQALWTKHKGKEWAWSWKCTQPQNFVESCLFNGIGRVILMSGTLKPFAFKTLGVDLDEVDFKEWPRIFPSQNCPVIHIKTGIKMNYETERDEEKMVRAVEAFDSILGMDGRGMRRKGIVQTVSYGRQKMYMEKSKYADYMIGNTADPNSSTALDIANAFRKMKPPAILVSPSFGTGWDFPGSECMWIICTKIPWPNVNDEVLKARAKQCAKLPSSIAVQALVQSTARGDRDTDDICEVFITDDGMTWFANVRNKDTAGLFPISFEHFSSSQIPGLLRPDIICGPRDGKEDGKQFDKLGFWVDQSILA